MPPKVSAAHDARHKQLLMGSIALEKIKVAMRTSQFLQSETSDQAADHLAQQLYEHTSSNSIIVTSPAAIELATRLANLLNLPLEVIPSRVIRHPGNPSRLIGSVTVDEFVLDNDLQDIPQDYVSHQLLLTQASVRKDYESYYSKVQPASFRNKTVIFVDVVICSAHPAISCLKSIRGKQPDKVIVAALYMTAEASRSLSEMADQLTFFEMISENISNNTTRREREHAVKRLNEFRDDHALV